MRLAVVSDGERASRSTLDCGEATLMLNAVLSVKNEVLDSHIMHKLRCGKQQHGGDLLLH